MMNNGTEFHLLQTACGGVDFVETMRAVSSFALRKPHNFLERQVTLLNQQPSRASRTSENSESPLRIKQFTDRIANKLCISRTLERISGSMAPGRDQRFDSAIHDLPSFKTTIVFGEIEI